MAKKLTEKQKLFIAEYIKTGNGVQSALKVYNTDSYINAGHIATDNLSKPAIRDEIGIIQTTLKQALIDKGITPEKIASKIDELLEAKGDDRYTIIDKGLKHATNIYGITDDPSKDKDKQSNTYNFIFSPENQADIKAIEERIKARLVQSHDHESI